MAALALIAPTAAADPGPPTPRPLSGGGSDTTQNVMNALAEVITIDGVKQLGSYNAEVGTVPDPYTTKPGCTIPRARTNGSTNGVRALQDAQQGAPDLTGTGGVPCLDFARSSSQSSANFPSNPPGGPGQLSYIPFAVDGLTVVTRDDSPLPVDFSIADLQAIYNCQFPITDVRPVLPQRGSGSRAFFLSRLGIAEPAEDTRPCINVDFPGRVGPQENRGNALTDSRQILPYSIAVFQSQLYGRAANDIGRALPRNIDSELPKNPNPAYLGGVTTVIRSDSPLPISFSTTELRDIYRCVTDPIGADVRPVLPAPGVVRNAFLDKIDPGLTQVQKDTYEVARPCINLDFLATGRVGPPENQGNQLIDPRSIMPHSIQSFLDQLGGRIADNRGRSRLTLCDDIPPTVLNTAVTLARDVYNVIPTSRETTAPESTVFVGQNSLICQNTAIINSFGFGTAANCGQIAARTT